MKPFSLVGVDGNAYSVMGYVSMAMKQAGYTEEEIKQYTKQAMSSDYNHLLAVSIEFVDKCNEYKENYK